MREHPHWVHPAVVGFLVQILADREPADTGFAVLAEYAIDVTALPPAPLVAEQFLMGRGILHAAAGDSSRAAADFEASGEYARAWGNVNPAITPWRSHLGLALHTLDRSDEAVVLVDEELELATGYGAPRAIGIALRARALLRHGADEIAGLEHAVEVLARSTARLEHARALIDLGSALRRNGRRGDARDVLRTGLDAGDRCGAHQLGARARSELQIVGARPRRARLSGPEALTASELRVAELAARAMTNRQIAQALFVTAKTVEMHLARVYAKLDIKSRKELPRALRGDARSQIPAGV